MDGQNPCEVCKARGKASGCDNCILDESSRGECHNDECFCNYECGCLLGLDDVCKASTCYEDDPEDHTCEECVNCRACDDGGYCCENTDEAESIYDTACEDFEEADAELY